MKKLVIGILAHADAGKTTLSEALLYHGGALRALGRVDKGDTFLDTNEMERARGITIFSKEARFKTDIAEFVLIDTPGHVDFSSEMERALGVLDIAVLVISGSEGVQPHTKTLWRLLGLYNIPTVVFVNKMDMPTADMGTLTEDMQEQLSKEIIMFGAYTQGLDNKSEVLGCGKQALLTPEIYENIATCDEALLEEYLSTETIADESLRRAIGERKLYPCIFGSALKLTGVETLLEVLGCYGMGIEKSTDDIALQGESIKLKDSKAGNVNADANADIDINISTNININTNINTNTDEPFSAYCYKITRSGDGTRRTHLRVLSGSLKVKALFNGEKINDIRLYSGERYNSVSFAEAGEIIAIPGLKDTLPGHSYGGSDKVNIPHLAPVLSYAIRYPDTVANTLMLSYLRELEEELPELYVEYDNEHREIRVSLMGTVQTEVLGRLINDRYGVPVTFDVGSISYKETITDIVEGVGHFEPLRHYAEVHLKLEPLDLGMGLVFDSDLSEDVLDRNWQRLIKSHLEERTHRGVLTGSPITDMKITLIGGRAHPKHTEGGDFRQAVIRAVRQGLMQAHSRLLEPYYDFTLEIPQGAVGRAMTDIDKMNGSFELSKNISGTVLLNGRAPVATLHNYGKEVAEYTGGEGSLFLTPGGYGICHNEQEIIDSFNYNPEEDVKNPSASVFCQHGAGVMVPWNEIFEHMHIPPCLDEGSNEVEAIGLKPILGFSGAKEINIGTDEIDEIINRTAYSNRKPVAVAHKGISAKRAEMRQRQYIAPKEVEYKGTVQRKKYLLVDGYNVIYAWRELAELAAININGARDKLLDILCNYQGMTGLNIIAVFDAYRLSNHPTEFLDYNNIYVVYTRTAETADYYIEKFAHENGKKYDITVVTSDGLEQIIIRGQGCHLMSSREFELLINNTYNEFKRTHCVE